MLTEITILLLGLVVAYLVVRVNALKQDNEALTNLTLYSFGYLNYKNDDFLSIETQMDVAQEVAHPKEQ